MRMVATVIAQYLRTTRQAARRLIPVSSSGNSTRTFDFNTGGEVVLELVTQIFSWVGSGYARGDQAYSTGCSLQRRRTDVRSHQALVTEALDAPEQEGIQGRFRLSACRRSCG